jgi:hypothetical protein
MNGCSGGDLTVFTHGAELIVLFTVTGVTLVTPTYSIGALVDMLFSESASADFLRACLV